MSDAEHLIENAIMALERYPYKEAERYFMEAPINIMMSKDSGCPLNAVWEMAIYCDTTLRQYWKDEWEKEAETHGDIDRERIEAILKKHGTYILSTIDGQGCHVGCYKGIALDADANWIIEAEVESMSETNCGEFIPVVHGEWINCNGGNATCSHCKTRQKNVYDDENEQRFCGHCGAKMGGGGHGN